MFFKKKIALGLEKLQMGGTRAFIKLPLKT